MAHTIKTETKVGGNTADRVGSAFEGVADALEGTEQISEMDKAVQEVQQQVEASKAQIQSLVNALPVVQQTGDSTTSVMSQKAVTDSILKDIHPAFFKDSFIIADLAGNVAFEVDKSGKTKISNVDKKPTTNSDNLVTSGGVKESIDEAVNSVSAKDIYPDLYEDSLYVSDLNGYVAFQVDENGQTKYVGKVSDIYDNFNQDKFIIADKNGFVVAKIDNTGASFAFKNPMNFIERKVFYTLGDSLSAANKYQLKLAEITGAVFDADANIDSTKPISVGGTTTMGANATSGFQRARNLVSLSGNKDVVIIENINDVNHVSYGGDINSSPYTEYPDGTNNGATKTLYGAYKWLCEYLITNLPSTQLFWMIPNRIAINYSSPETRSDGTIDMDYYTSTQAHEQYMQLVTIQKEVAAYYGIPVLDMIAESGMNYINGGTFFYDNNVHPKDIGYYRWGETIARLLTSK